ncbi:Fic family protein [Rhizobium sp. P44RR-XXIV]|uniref:Fic family protein n=1 Tax=Rhizobium sp. P44RR-XXIV TaxID=1921145 RepID=UPI000984156C|nr:Fic family protein [Rhizobium sp. P44RR-XXIV]TIX93546.1 Fic family protein [Rhizobium sp. P44RR-XXIV]
MTTEAMQPIWNPATGITDLESGPRDLSASEIPGIKAVWTEQRMRLKGTSQLSDFTEKLSREWAIETGVIENLYEIERGVTQTLIERGFQAELLSHGSTNKPREYVIQLLRDQKEALDGVFDFVKSDRSLSTSYIKELHAALLRSQDTTEGIDAQGHHVEIDLIKGTWKTKANYPVRDGVTYMYCPPEHVQSEMDRLISLHAQHVSAGVPTEVQASWLHHRFTQIHPFQDGNGRVARAIASLVLVKDGLFPLVVTRDDKPNYLDTLEAADNGNLKPLISLTAKLQITQFRKATAISEAILAEDDVQAALGGLIKAAGKIAADKISAFKGVFELAHRLEDDLEQRLKALAPTILTALQKVANNSSAFVTRSNEETSHYFRSQVIENAKNHLDYYADTADFRSWVALNLRWSRRGQLVFAIHGIGRPFNGSLICAPFFEFKDTDEDGQIRTALVPVAEEGFVFFYNEDPERLASRFAPWREGVLKIVLKELSQNL